jgi:hypothetical protein
VDKDERIGGILLYETCHSSRNEKNMGLIEQYGPVGLNPEAATALQGILRELGYS